MESYLHDLASRLEGESAVFLGRGSLDFNGVTPMFQVEIQLQKLSYSYTVMFQGYSYGLGSVSISQTFAGWSSQLVFKGLGSPPNHGVRPLGRGTTSTWGTYQPWSMAINHLLTGMILQLGALKIWVVSVPDFFDPSETPKIPQEHAGIE